MYDFEYEIIELARKLKIRIDKLEKEFAGLPEGRIITIKKNNHFENFHRVYKGGKRNQTYLSLTKDRALINLLIDKQQKAPLLKKELKIVYEQYNQILPMAKKILDNIKTPRIKYSPFYSENPKNPEYLKYVTLRGELVRSISEKTIADALFRYNLDYKYEKALQLGKVTIYPDFTVTNPINGKTYYWEFLGLNSEEYLKSWDFKVSRFSENNISRENYLLVTKMEEINTIESVIKENFTLERYKNLIS